MLQLKNIFLILLISISTKLSSTQNWATPLYKALQNKSSINQSTKTSQDSSKEKKDYIIRLLDETLETQGYWKQLEYNPLKKFFTTNPVQTIKKLFSPSKNNEDTIKTSVKTLKEVQILLALALSYYESNHSLSPEEETFFFKQIEEVLTQNSKSSFIIRNWATILALSAATYGASKNETIVSACTVIKDNSKKIIKNIQEFYSNNTQPSSFERIPTFQELKTSLTEYYKNSKKQYISARNNYEEALFDTILTTSDITPNDLQGKTISELQKIRDNMFNFFDAIEGKLGYTLAKSVRKGFTPKWWENFRGGHYVCNDQEPLSQEDQAYLNSIVAQANYYTEACNAAGKTLITGYIIYKMTGLLKSTLKSSFNFAHGIANRKPSLTELKKNLLYCERLLNHARTEGSSTYYTGMLLYFIEKLNESSSKISSTWQLRFMNDLEDLKNPALSFDQKYETVKAMMRDYSFLNN